MSNTLCLSCNGSGEMPTDNGLLDCPDCGGSGTLPSRAVLNEWRCRDLQKRLHAEPSLPRQDALWLLAELQAASAALNTVIALAHDIEGDANLAFRIRMEASRAIGLYEQTDASQPAP
jgi:hypothetical protein